MFTMDSENEDDHGYASSLSWEIEYEEYYPRPQSISETLPLRNAQDVRVLQLQPATKLHAPLKGRLKVISQGEDKKYEVTVLHLEPSA